MDKLKLVRNSKEHLFNFDQEKLIVKQLTKFRVVKVQALVLASKLSLFDVNVVLVNLKASGGMHHIKCYFFWIKTQDLQMIFFCQ